MIDITARPPAMNPQTSKEIVALLSEVIPSDKFGVIADPAMGFHGVAVRVHATKGEWYFDTTWGGDDGYTEYVRCYYTTLGGDCLDQSVDDNPPFQKRPLLSDGPLTIAKWIVACVGDGEAPQ